MKKYYFILSLCLIGNIGVQAQLLCDGADILQTLDITSNDQIAASETLTATNEITGSAIVTYQAGDYVLLKGGFFIKENASLIAKTEVCTPTNNRNIEGFQMSILNNPTTSTASVELTLENSIELKITLLNLLGQEVEIIQSMQEIFSGSHSLNIDLSNYSKGSYFLHFRTPRGQMNTLKLIKI